MIGEKLGSFRIEATLGVGAMGVVYKAINESNGRSAAVKVVNHDIAQRGKTYERFRREAEILQQFRHSNIVRFLAVGRYKGTSYFAMEYVPGNTLEQALRDRGPLPWQTVVDLGIQMCEALHYLLHEHGVVHRDLKPSNLMVTDDDRIKLTDFGIAKDLDATALTATGRTLGTAAYMAPEQIRGTPEVSHKTDLYALGIVFFQMLTGEAPFEGASPVVLMHSHLNGAIPRASSKVAEIPKALDNLIAQMMAKEPADRPWDAAAVGVTLGEIRGKAERGEKLKMVWPTGEVDTQAPTRASTDKVKKKKKKTTAKLRTESGDGERRQAAGTIGLGLGLVAVGALIAYLVWPPSAETLFHNAEKLMASANRHDWIAARDNYIEVLDRKHPNHPYKQTLTAWRDKLLLADAEGRAKTLQSAVRTPLSEPQTKNEQRYREFWIIIAGKQEKQPDDLAGQKIYYEEFAKPLDENVPDDRQWILLARERIKDLENQEVKRRETVTGLLERLRKAIETGDATAAESIRTEVLNRYGQNPEFRELFERLGLIAPAATPPQDPTQATAPPDSGKPGPS